MTRNKVVARSNLREKIERRIAHNYFFFHDIIHESANAFSCKHGNPLMTINVAYMFLSLNVALTLRMVENIG